LARDSCLLRSLVSKPAFAWPPGRLGGTGERERAAAAAPLGGIEVGCAAEREAFGSAAAEALARWS
jgi:hypothetical protein